MPPTTPQKTTPKPLLAVSIIVTTIIIIIVAIVLYKLFRGNPYGEETTITNISEASGLSQDQRDLLSSQLHNFIQQNTEDQTIDIDDQKGTIREGTLNITKDTTEVYSGNFIVDIPDLKQTYYVYFSLPRSKYADMSGAGFNISCPPSKYIIYPETKCSDYQNSSPENVSWLYSYQLEYTYGMGTTQKIVTSLKQFIMDNYGSNPDRDILVYINETSLRKLPNQPGITYQLSVTINDLVANLVIQTDEGFGDQYIFVYMQNESDKKYTAQLLADDKTIINSVSNWAKNYFNAPNMTISVNKLKD